MRVVFKRNTTRVTVDKRENILIEDRVAMIMNVLHSKVKMLIAPSVLLLVCWDLRHKMAAVGFVCTLPMLDVIALNR